MIDEFLLLAKEKHKTHVKFLKKLKQKKPKSLDSIALESHEEVFENIDCLECANCCKTTGPLFTDNDIKRISKLFKLKPLEFIDKYLVLDEDNDYVLNTLPCPFLEENNECFIYEHRPKACREFPHTNRKNLYQINHLTIENVKVCPAAFQIIEKIQTKLNL